MLGRKKSAPKKTVAAKKKSAKSTSQSDEAKAVLAKMKAKSDAGDCAFC